MNKQIVKTSITWVLLLTGWITPLLTADEGMWLFNDPPIKQLKDKYGFEITPEWLEHLQKASVRFNSGGSGSFVSSRGLVLSNHHVAADALQKLSSAERDLMKEGFYARTTEEEMPCVDLELNVLISIKDVTDRVNAAVKPGLSSEQAFLARRAVMAEIEKESLETSGLRSDVVTLFQGGAYHLYRFKKYTDVRLVFAPELQAAFFGGDPDNFEYPRYCLDFAFFRAYENDKPAQINHYLQWNSQGATEGELVFVTGHPGRTSRLLTVAELKYERDVLMPDVLSLLYRREVVLGTYSNRNAENARRAKDYLFGVQNGRKAYRGMHAGLLNPTLFSMKVQKETALRRAVAANSKLANYADAWDRIDAAQRRILANRNDYNLFERGRAFYSELFGIAQTLLRAADELPKPNGERLREFNEAALDSLKFQLFSEKPIYEDLEILTLTDSLTYLCESLGYEDSLVQAILDGQSPRQRATELVMETKIKDVTLRKHLFEEGKQAVKSQDDPMIELARRVDQRARAARQVIETATEMKQVAHAEISKARFAIEGSSRYPDATFTLRLAFGAVAGYTEDGRHIPYQTTFDGLYRRAESQGHKAPFNITQRWMAARDRLDLKVPVNFVSKIDIIGGNSGSPVVNRAGEVVGLIFDGNIHSLPWRYGYDDTLGRATSVHTGGIMEALRQVYRADSLVKELQAGKQ